jgi:hypothetical protein
LRRAVRILTVAALGAVVLGALGCGHRHPPPPSSPTARALKVESEDLLDTYRALGRAAPSTQREINAAKAVWPLIYAGLPKNPSAGARAAVENALKLTQQIYRPSLFEEEKAAVLTGPASELAGLFWGFTALAERSWTQILATIRQEEGGPSPQRAFARSTVNLYIESIYDAHFQLAQIGKKLEDAYKKLGGPTEFEGPLTEADVQRIAKIYSEPNARLYPHVQATLGS